MYARVRLLYTELMSRALPAIRDKSSGGIFALSSAVVLWPEGEDRSPETDISQSTTDISQSRADISQSTVPRLADRSTPRVW
jgi:hypothetical protein